ncbi:ComEC/Rec2 family competence protein [Paracoccus sp. DMF-8]|uniref:ComEC/Rec2 family competence protein n=1 Tax=Paracoccus sp. DMF-8 TaxID=3019445 RepID=UPI0023E890F2|nr:ComEC/Rec2 family competence protein [Paracoccus sp. DMF-8]MDF3605951.1 ComEC/Rec2 family competence protein [Paracoccus sp. DMF-8]
MALHRLRMQLSQAMQDRIGGQAGAVAAALMTGDRSGIAEATNEVMRISSLYHIISISGLHMTMLAAFVYGTLRFFGVCVVAVMAHLRGGPMAPPLHKIAAGGAILASAGYLWLSGGGVATERAFIMVAVMLFAILVDMRAISLRTVAIAAVIVLVLGPEALTTPGFQMSFAATVVLVLMSHPWRAVSAHLPRWSHAILLLFLTSVFAGLATGPLAAAQFGRIAPYGLLANALVVPVMGAFVMNMGVIALFLAPFGLEGISLWVMGLGTTWMLWVAEWIAGWNGADLLVPLPPGPVLPLIGTGLMLTTLTARRMWRWRGCRLPAPVFSVGILMLAAGFMIWIGARRPDVLISAQGDAVGIMTPAGRAMSKESGGAFHAENWLADDGDAASQARSAARPGPDPLWQGPRNRRSAMVDAGGQALRFVHATGKSAPDAATAACGPATVVIVDDRAGQSGDAACLLLDLSILQQSGAIAIWFDRGRPVVATTAQRGGSRDWSPGQPGAGRALAAGMMAALTASSGN